MLHVREQPVIAKVSVVIFGILELLAPRHLTEVVRKFHAGLEGKV